MNTSGEAADQVMRMMLNGAEVLIKLSGSGAKNAAVLLYSIAREQKKTKGAARLESMLRSGKPLKVYTFRDSDLPKFKEVAKQYGILYTVLKEKDKTGGVFDVMVRAEDESKIARITERFNLARVNTADLRAEIIREKEELEKDEGKTDVPETDKPEKSADEKLADEILGKTRSLPTKFLASRFRRRKTKWKTLLRLGRKQRGCRRERNPKKSFRPSHPRRLPKKSKDLMIRTRVSQTASRP